MHTYGASRSRETTAAYFPLTSVKTFSTDAIIDGERVNPAAWRFGRVVRSAKLSANDAIVRSQDFVALCKRGEPAAAGIEVQPDNE
jgi:hypothetical protein